jgi:Skp family chaperone for outer membrane proteins
MKTLSAWLAVMAFPALAIGLAQQRVAPTTGPMAYVSSQRVSNETVAGKAGLARLQAMQRERAADVRTKQQALEATRRQLQSVQDEAGRARLQTQEQQQRTEFEQAVTKAQTDIQSLQRLISAELGTKLKAVIEEVVKGTGVQMVLTGENTLVWAAPGLDLSSIVIEKLNAQSSAPRTP